MGCAGATESKDDSDDTVTTTHDGDAGAPQALTLGQVWEGKVGSFSSLADSSSFYQFNSGNQTSLLVDIMNSAVSHGTSETGYTVRLYEGPISSDVKTYATAQDTVAPIFEDLKPNTLYSLQVENLVRQATTYQIRVRALPEDANEGSIAAPVALTLGQKHGAFTTSLDSGRSYYKFNTGVHTSVTVSYNQGLLDSYLYKGATFAFQDEIGAEYEFTGQSLTVSELTPNTDYYLALEFYTVQGAARCTFDLTVTGN